MSLLSVENLSVAFESETRRVNAVRNVFFNVGAGEKLGFVGESGSGKTTTALTLLGMTPPSGEIKNGLAYLSGLDLFGLSAEEMIDHRLKTVSYIPQGAMNSLNPVQRIRDSILDGMIDHGVVLSRSQADDTVTDLLEKVGLSAEIARRYPHELSGGMKQRVCIAIAIAMKPKLLIADEPTSALDVITQRQVMETLGAVQEEIGSGLVLIGHDMGLMAQFVDRMIVMRKGQIVEDAETRDIFSAPKDPYTKKLMDSVPKLPARARQDEPAAPETQDAALDNSLFSLEDLSVTFGGGLFGEKFTALHPMTMQFSNDTPQIIALVGQSGSGKSTLGRAMLGFQKPSTGRVVFQGQDISKLPKKGRLGFRRNVQAIFQDPYASFNPFYTVDHAFIVPLLRFGIAETRKEAYDLMGGALSSVGLEPNATFGTHAHQLSGGQRQRLMVARALAMRPKFIVADEPVSMIDASLRSSILDSISALRDDHGISVLYITHDLATAYRASDGVVVLHNGRVVEVGDPDLVIRDPQHPYSRLLIDSIPTPDPNQKWADGRQLTDDVIAASEAEGAHDACVRGQIKGFRYHGS